MKTLLLLIPALAFGQAVYEIDSAHSGAHFAVRHMAVSNVRGEFGGVKGSIVYDPKNLAASKVEATIDARTINTREPKRDDHLKSADFFDVAKFPTLSFRSKQFYQQAGQLKVKGDLTMHGVTKEVVLDVDGPTPEAKDPWGKLRIGAQATTRINRKEWGLLWNKTLEAGSLLVGEEVSITLDLEAVRKAPASKTDD